MKSVNKGHAVIERLIVAVPNSPGVYIMKDGDGNYIYVGKGKDLKARLRSYLGNDDRFMIPYLLSKVQDVEIIVTETEKEALILENNLIKEYRPRYNIYFRDDKSYFHIRVDLRETYPRFTLYRRPKQDGALYFGPYPSGASARETLDILQSAFHFRTCSDKVLKRNRPCIEFQIGRCMAPCVGCVDEGNYRKAVLDAIALLEGREKKLLVELERKMMAFAEKEMFEEAAIIRDKLLALNRVIEKQKITSNVYRNQDVYGLYYEEGAAQICILRVKEGKIIGQESPPLIRPVIHPSEVLSAVIQQRYDRSTFIPDEIILPEDIEQRTLLSDWLSEKKGKRVNIKVPKKGKNKNLVEMARRNAENLFKLHLTSEENPADILKLMARVLKLKEVPQRIECFDISNMGGRYAVGSRVLFRDGMLDKSLYRRYRIRLPSGFDDYAMMSEVLKRRFAEDETPPDLVIVDGGKGHLSVTRMVLDEMGHFQVEAVAITKGESRRRRKRDRNAETTVGADLLYVHRRKEPIILKKYPQLNRFLQRIRNEAHRFAINYHRRLRDKEGLESSLVKIPGIGHKRSREILRAFCGLEELKTATSEELQRISGVGKKTAQIILDYLNKKGAE
ncbi:MAG: excinuclease ABC subunit UvrC [Syntrophales bacterium]|nr:excinuclease ABC subunit UvrC [Syntrophales bacterium]